MVIPLSWEPIWGGGQGKDISFLPGELSDNGLSVAIIAVINIKILLFI